MENKSTPTITELIETILFEICDKYYKYPNELEQEDKKCRGGVIVKLLIPRGAIVFSINGRKCRTNKAKVFEIEGATKAISQHKYMSYYVGDEFTVYDFNCEYNVECAPGIHFFMTREKVMNY